MMGEDIIWVSLPVPALLLDVEDRITNINPEAEVFLNTSLRSLEGAVRERLASEPVAK